MHDSRKKLVQVVNVSKGGVVIARRIEWAGSSSERRRGLLGRNNLITDEGIYLTPCEWLHTFGMQFPIDVAFISPEGLILAVHHGLRPNRLSKIVLRAAGALELSEGTLRQTKTEIDDVVQFMNSSTMVPISA